MYDLKMLFLKTQFSVWQNCYLTFKILRFQIAIPKQFILCDLVIYEITISNTP
jgi:hypothetical protein